MGLARAAKRLMDAYLGAKKHFLFFDKGYSGRNTYWRVSLGAWQPLAYFQRFMRPPDRLKRAGFRIWPHPVEKLDYNNVVFAGACQNYSNFMDLGNVNDYNLSVLQKLREHTDRKIIYRPNPSWYNKHHDEFRPIQMEVENVELSPPEVPFAHELDDCHLLVTHGTGAAVAAVAQGVPSMVLGPGICRPVSMTDENWNRVDNPFLPKDEARHQFFADLHYCQWTIEEYRNGAAWADLRLALAYLTGEPAPLIDQYKVMHTHPRYFRGLTTRKYADQISTLLGRHDIDSLLDYGSGKGEQYRPPTSLDLFWGVPGKVTCYDPAVARFSTPPKGRFDAVICCDVMEHIPEEDVPETLWRIMRYASKTVFFAIATSPAVKALPDGRNCHVTVRPREWWGQQIALASSGEGIGQLDIELVTTARDEQNDTASG
jgi:hypothetical protein